MEIECPRCQTINPEIARFCRSCGLSLAIGPNGSRHAGLIAHPCPVATPAKASCCDGALDLFYQVESSMGGPALLSTEGATIRVFNRGYPLCQVVLEIIGWESGEDPEPLLTLDRTIERIDRGQEVRLEVPSYEISEPLEKFTVAFVSANFG